MSGWFSFHLGSGKAQAQAEAKMFLPGCNSLSNGTCEQLLKTLSGFLGKGLGAAEPLCPLP